MSGIALKMVEAAPKALFLACVATVAIAYMMLDALGVVRSRKPVGGRKPQLR